MSKPTLVVGASHNPERYSHQAINLLSAHGHDVIAIGRKSENKNGLDIQSGQPEIKGIDTVSLYINPSIQAEYEDYLIRLKPNRIIFNPGTENPSFFARAKDAGIDVENACTLVLLRIDQY